jgi:CelD/BcsL family acetyltransferase involved in cellulose biosynthesis
VPATFSRDAQDFGRRDWSDLVEADPSATVFHTPPYLKLYWEELGGKAELLLTFVEEAGRVIGAVAFERESTTLRFLGGTEVTDYMGPVALAGTEDRVAKEVMQALDGIEGWATADLRGLPEDSPWLNRLADAASARAYAVDVGEDAVAPLLDLPQTFEEYLAGLPGKLRHEIRRKARRLEEEAGGHTITYSTTESLGFDLDCFVALHRSSEGPKGKFMEPGMEVFFRRLGESFLPRGIFRLVFLEVGDKKTAGAIGLSYKGTFSLYNSAFEREWRHLAPGMVLVAELIREAIEGRCTAFDMLKGDLEYKYRFGARQRHVKKLLISRR